MGREASPVRLFILGGWLLGVLLGAASGHQPTGVPWWDALITALFVAIVSVALGSSVHPIPVQLVLVAGLLLGAGGWIAACGITLLLRVVFRRNGWEDEVLRTAVGVVGANGLLHLRDLGGFGRTAAVVAALVLFVLASSWGGMHARPRRWLARVGGGLLAVVLVAVVGVAFAGWHSLGPAIDGSESARQGLEAARDGEVEEASVFLSTAVDSLSRADRRLSSWYARPARLIPVLGQHLEVGQVAVRNAEAVARAAETALVDADVDALRVSGGQVDLGRLAEMSGPLEAVHSSLSLALTELDQARSPWLLSPVTARLDEVHGELNRALPDAQKAATATRLLPAMLGADEPRRYLVLFAMPAEARELGGIVGNVVELTVDDGRVAITGQKQDKELNAAAPGHLADPASYPARFTINRPDLFSQNWSGTTDFPTVARAVSELYPSMGGQPLDGVLYVDPFAIAALMQFTGPVEIDELERTLDAGSVVDFLLVDQYRAFEQPERVGFLDRIAVTTFDRLLSADLPSPRRLGAVLGPAARQGRLQMVTFDDEETRFLHSLFLVGSVPPVDDRDHLAVVHANGGSDKLDGFLDRKVTYNAVVDDTTGELNARVLIELTNRAPDDLPAYVIGKADRLVPQGTNRVHLSIFTTHELGSFRVRGEEVDAELQREHGYQRYLAFVDVKQGETAVVEIDLEGVTDLSEGLYRLTVAAQPLANPDHLIIDAVVGDQRLFHEGRLVEDSVFELDLEADPTGP